MIDVESKCKFYRQLSDQREYACSHRQRVLSRQFKRQIEFLKANPFYNARFTQLSCV